VAGVKGEGMLLWFGRTLGLDSAGGCHVIRTLDGERCPNGLCSGAKVWRQTNVYPRAKPTFSRRLPGGFAKKRIGSH
jgi:hypothetical protein